MVDNEGKIILVNSETEKMFGYDRMELIGQPVEMLASESSRPLYSEARAEYLAQPPARAMVYRRDLYGRRKDGSEFPLEVGLNPIETAEGTAVVSSIADRTDQKRAKEALRESEERFQNMADTAPVMIWVSGPDKLCTFFNKRWLDFTGRAAADELGEGWVQGVHPEDLDRCVATYRTSFDTRRHFQAEFRLRRADGTYRWLLSDGAPRFEGEAFAGYIGSCVDITEIKRSQEQALARQKVESLGSLIGGIAHDFNNLLGAILANAELALSDPAVEYGSRQEVQTIWAVATRASEIVRELMIYAGQEKARLESVDVSTLVEEMLQLLKISISKYAFLKTDLLKGLPAVLANAAQIRQVVMNLIINASEAIAAEGGVIIVTTSKVSVDQRAVVNGLANLPPGDYVRLSVSDTGHGIKEDLKSKIFDPFFTTKFAGRGLGLAVVQTIVETHGGSINVVSGRGRGTRFDILLPCAGRATAPGQSAALPTPPVPAPAAVGTVLLVDDEDGLRVAVSKMLRKKGFKVMEVGDGAEAIDLFRKREDEIDVILLDMTIPKMSSHEVIAEAQRINPDVKVILTTAYSREMAAPCFEAPQIKGFIRKPYQIADLVRLLTDVLSS